jgi:hypothetical protein
MARLCLPSRPARPISAEGALSDTTSDKDRGQDTAQISGECLAQLKELANSRAEQKALLRAIATGGPQHFALTLDDFDSPVAETTVTG